MINLKPSSLTEFLLICKHQTIYFTPYKQLLIIFYLKQSKKVKKLQTKLFLNKKLQLSVNF